MLRGVMVDGGKWRWRGFDLLKDTLQQLPRLTCIFCVLSDSFDVLISKQQMGSSGISQALDHVPYL